MFTVTLLHVALCHVCSTMQVVCVASTPNLLSEHQNECVRAIFVANELALCSYARALL